MIQAFEGNKSENTTMVAAIQAFAAAHQPLDVTVVADAGMVLAGNQKAFEDVGRHIGLFITGSNILTISSSAHSRSASKGHI